MKPQICAALGDAAGHAAADGNEALMAVPVDELAKDLRRAPDRAAAAAMLAGFRGGFGQAVADEDDPATLALRALERLVLELSGSGRGKPRRKPLPRPTGEAVIRRRA